VGVRSAAGVPASSLSSSPSSPSSPSPPCDDTAACEHWCASSATPAACPAAELLVRVPCVLAAIVPTLLVLTRHLCCSLLVLTRHLCCPLLVLTRHLCCPLLVLTRHLCCPLLVLTRHLCCPLRAAYPASVCYRVSTRWWGRGAALDIVGGRERCPSDAVTPSRSRW
jgi:hypothetical protein